MNYKSYLSSKKNVGEDHGFKPVFMPDKLFDFQKYMVEWALLKGRGAMFEDCGLGKSFQQLVWAENVHRHTNKPVLILAPLAVSAQTVREGNKFDIEVTRSHDGKAGKGITITNYEQLHKFDSNDYGGVVCDESSILKSFNGERKKEITRFMLKMPYRLLATATAAPNDYIELGTSSEALGYMGHMDMLNRFFKNEQNNSSMRRMYGEAPKWRFKGHSELPFWQWVSSWARAIRKPSDIGFDDSIGFNLPPLNITNHLIDFDFIPDGEMFSSPAMTLKTQREESKRSIVERCEMVAELINYTEKPALVWCHRNEEGDLLEKIIEGSVQVAGKHSDAQKEDRLLSFLDQETRVLVTKPRIGAWGLNFQHCAHIAYFPSHSYESFYQAIRRCWRFGQKNPVQVDIVLTPGEQKILDNLEKKAKKADVMFENLVNEMNNSLSIDTTKNYSTKLERPTWL